jgi:hypothetical protein
MIKYKLKVSMRAVWLDEIELEDDQALEFYLRSKDYELPEEPDWWEDFEIEKAIPIKTKETA